MKSPWNSLVTRISLVSIVHLLSMLGVIFLVSWATFEPSVQSGIVRHAELCVINMVGADRDAKLSHELLHEEAESLAEVGVRFAVYDEDGSLLAANTQPPLERLSPDELTGLTSTSAIVRREAPPVFGRTLRLANGKPGHVVFSPPPFGPPIRPLLPGLLLALLASAIGAVLLARSFASPLSKLSAAAQRLGSGDLRARAELPRRDEFGQLARSFDDMAEQLGVLVRTQQELLANVSHELRTPLARIRAALDFAADSKSGASSREEAMRDVSVDLGELERLVADVLQTARLDLAAGKIGPHMPVLRRERIPAIEVIDNVAARFRAHHPQRALDLDLAPALSDLDGDPVLLRRMLDNIADNAQKYSDVGTPIVLRACERDGELEVSIEDRGIGIAPEDIPRITTPFFRTDRSRARKTGGLGLGLSLARRIAEAHGGRLSLESQPNVGTRVTVSVPVAPANTNSDKGALDESRSLARLPPAASA